VQDADDFSPPTSLIQQFPFGPLYETQPPNQYRYVQLGDVGNVFVVTDFIQQFVSQNESSAGFVVTSASGGSDTFSFYGREAINTEPRYQPTLTVDFTGPIPEPATLIIWSLIGALGIGWWWRKRAA
jgi:hypothetical protein